MPARRTKNSTHGDERRTTLLAAFAELLEERPFAEIGVEEIASRAGLTRSAFYFYFPNKAAAVAALVGDLFEGAVDTSTRWIQDREGDPHERVLPAIEAAVNRRRTHSALYVAMADAAAADPEIGAVWASLGERVGAVVAAQLREERQTGVATDGPAAGPYVEALLGMMNRALDQEARRVQETGRGTPGLAKILTEVWVRALYGRAE